MTDDKPTEKQDIKEVELTRMVEDVIDKGANSAEEIHRAVGELPITVLENLGLEETAAGVKKVQDRSIGAIYKLIRTINHEVAGMASELLEQRDKIDRNKP